MLRLKKQLTHIGMVWLLTLVFAGGAFAFRVTKDVHKIFELPFGSDIRVENVNGEISVSCWDQEKVELTAKITVNHRSRRTAEEYLEKVEVSFDHGRNFLGIEVDHPKWRGDGIWSWLFGGSKPSASVELRLMVPSKCNVEVGTVNGHVEVENVRGRLQARTTNGSIRIRNVDGELSCRTVNGRIIASLPDIEDVTEITLRTFNGSIRLEVPASLSADLEASTVNGSIESDLPLQVSGKINRRSIHGRLNDGGGLIFLKTVNGSIQIREFD